MALSITLHHARAAARDSVDGFSAAAHALDEHALLGASRCHGWTRLDVVVHVIAGWQEMLMGLVSPVDGPPTVDAASYWRAYADEYGGGDQIPVLMEQRRRTAVYSRPSSALAQLDDLAAALLRGIEACRGDHLTWQGHTFAPGDFLAVWAVEHAIHHLDLLVDVPVPDTAMSLARATVAALAPDPIPADWSDPQVVLIGSGREQAPAGSPWESPVLG